MRHRKARVLDLQIKDEPVYALRTFLFFSYDVRRNVLDKLSKLQNNFKLLVSQGYLSLQKNKYCQNASPYQDHLCA